MNATEIFIIFILITVFITMVIAEILHMINQWRPNFIYEIYVNNHLIPLLEKTNDAKEICDIIISENKDNSVFLWRHAIFISFIVSIISTFLVKIFDPELKTRTFLILFLALFFINTLFMMLINFHYYGNKLNFINDCAEKIKKNIENN
jgi:hypothetical protein